MAIKFDELISNTNLFEFYKNYIPNLQNRPNQSGWISCHCPDRIDKKPSFSFNIEHGGFKDFATGKSGSIFDFLEIQGIFNKNEKVKIIKQYFKTNDNFIVRNFKAHHHL